MNQKYLVGVLVILIGMVGYFFFKINSLSGGTPGIKSFDIVLQNQAYSPDTVKVKLGDTVVFNIDNKDNEDTGYIYHNLEWLRLYHLCRKHPCNLWQIK